MWPSRKKQDVVEPVEIATKSADILQFPSASIPECPTEESKLRSYDSIAQSLGFNSAYIVYEKLLDFFKNEGIVVYDYDEVSRWMTSKKVKAGATHWGWRPLRDKDATRIDWGWDSKKGKWSDGYYSFTQCPAYKRLVPKHALEKALKIHEAFEDDVNFFVSDYASPAPDPFIMVRPSMANEGDANHKIVFDAWDEPGFGTPNLEASE